MKVIWRFNNLDEAVKRLKYWQNKLGLDDWVIKIKMCNPNEFVLEDVEGECEYEALTKSAVVRILKPKHYGDRIMKYCAELILVHELLHCKFAMLDSEDFFHGKITHNMLEEIARSFIFSKYEMDLQNLNNVHYD